MAEPTTRRSFFQRVGGTAVAIAIAPFLPKVVTQSPSAPPVPAYQDDGSPSVSWSCSVSPSEEWDGE